MKKPVYEVHLSSKEHELKRQYILIDGLTGKTLFTNTYFMKDEDSPSSFSLYLRALKKQEAEDNAYSPRTKAKTTQKKSGIFLKKNGIKTIWRIRTKVSGMIYLSGNN